jgi:hypothetical protein
MLSLSLLSKIEFIFYLSLLYMQMIRGSNKTEKMFTKSCYHITLIRYLQYSFRIVICITFKDTLSSILFNFEKDAKLVKLILLVFLNIF